MKVILIVVKKLILLRQLNQKDRKLDLILGVRKKFNQFEIENKNVGFTKYSIDIEGEKYLLTDALIELIFFKNVNNDSMSPNDVRDYKNIINNTNALRKKYEPDRSFKKINNNKKFDTYLNNFYEGSGLPKFMIAQNTSSNYDYVYWNDVNELVDRLKLLVAEKSAGNNSHDNEIMSIIEELREERIIY